MKKKVLILGSQGTLGQALVNRFSQAGYSVTAWDKTEADVTSAGISGQITDLKPEIIINSTAYNAVDKAESDEREKQLAFTLNAEVPGKLAAIAKDIGAIFVHYSTDNVFAGDKPEGYTEDETPAPVNVYGQSKYAGEKEVIGVGGHYYLIRLSRLFGVKGISPASKKSFVEIMLEKSDEPELTVMNVEKASLTYAPDLAKLTLSLIESGLPAGIYHGANEGECTWFEWAREIFRLSGRGPKLTPGTQPPAPRPAARPQFSRLLNTKLPPQRSWQEALKDFLMNYNGTVI